MTYSLSGSNKTCSYFLDGVLEADVGFGDRCLDSYFWTLSATLERLLMLGERGVGEGVLGVGAIGFASFGSPGQISGVSLVVDSSVSIISTALTSSGDPGKSAGSVTSTMLLVVLDSS